MGKSKTKFWPGDLDLIFKGTKVGLAKIVPTQYLEKQNHILTCWTWVELIKFWKLLYPVVGVSPTVAFKRTYFETLWVAWFVIVQTGINMCMSSDSNTSTKQLKNISPFNMAPVCLQPNTTHQLCMCDRMMNENMMSSLLYGQITRRALRRMYAKYIVATAIRKHSAISWLHLKTVNFTQVSILNVYTGEWSVVFL